MKANKRLLYATCTAISLPMLLASCQDDISGIGESVSRGEVVINIDSVGFKLNGRSVAAPVIDSRSTTNMLGRLSIPEYGDLRCSFVSRLISISELSIPDSITADSISHFRMILNIPRGQVTGDSLAPQRLKVYELTKQLPDAINNQFDPTGYYSESSLLGTRSYTASAVALGDSAYTKLTSIPLSIEMPLEKGKKVFEEYRNNPATFAWPASFAKFFPGIYVENDFGKGCVFNISNVKFNLYWRKRIKTSAVIDSVTTQVDKIVTDSLTVFATAPEVLSSNNISLTPSSAVTDAIARGEVMMQSPAGYNVEINFPAQEIIDEYSKQSSNLSIVNNLTLSIPVEHTSNDMGIDLPPYMLMVKRSELDEFFAKNKTPDDKTSFWGAYSSADKSYTFTSMRDYIVELIKAGGQVKPEDMEFTLVPVSISTETSSSGSATQNFVTACVPYLARPTLCRLLLDKAKIKFTFSSEQIF